MVKEQQISNGVNRTIRTIIGVVLVMVITFCAISICQNIGKRLKVDVTEQKLYTLSDGTKTILSKLNQPITIKLYYAKTAALKGSDQIRYFNNYYYFVRALLEEYAAVAKGMIDLKIIDPRPFSEDENDALRYGLKRFPITEEENFFFGLVVQTQFGIEKVIPFFSPDRQNFLEYDISYLIDNAIIRQKRRIGMISSLPVMGEDVSGYMAQMMALQGQRPKPAWTFVEQLRQQYEVKGIETDVNEIKDVDILLIVHPKDLPEKTLFAIDQFVLKGGRTIICIDPYCVVDQPSQMEMRMGRSPSQSSNLKVLLRTWGLEMPENNFAGDRSLAISASLTRNQRPEKIIGFLELNRQCFNADSVITSDLNQVRFLFAGVLKEISEPNEQHKDSQIRRTAVLTTTNRGNSWTVSSPYELMMPDPQRLMGRFVDGTQPVAMGYLITGKLKSSFPEGIEVTIEQNHGESSDKVKDPNDDNKTKKHLAGLAEASEDCAVAVFSDVDFISDILAYQESFFGKIVVGDNSALMMNTIDDLSGSSALIAMRSRGSFKRPFIRVDEIKSQAEAETAEEVAKINAEIAGYNNELQNILASAKQGQEEVVGSSILQKRRELELKIREAQKRLNDVKLKRRERVESLGYRLRDFNMLLIPAAVLVSAIVVGIRRSVRKRHYISHASDA